MKLTKIQQFTFREQDLDVLYDKGKLSYIFEYKGKRFGNMVKVDGRSVEAVVAATMSLLINFIETKDAADKL